MNKLGTRGLLYSSPRFLLKGGEAALLPKPIPTTTRRMVGADAAGFGRYPVRRVLWTSLWNAAASLPPRVSVHRWKSYFCKHESKTQEPVLCTCTPQTLVKKELCPQPGLWQTAPNTSVSLPSHFCRYCGNHCQLQKSCRIKSWKHILVEMLLKHGLLLSKKCDVSKLLLKKATKVKRAFGGGHQSCSKTEIHSNYSCAYGDGFKDLLIWRMLFCWWFGGWQKQHFFSSEFELSWQSLQSQVWKGFLLCSSVDRSLQIVPERTHSPSQQKCA